MNELTFTQKVKNLLRNYQIEKDSYTRKQYNAPVEATMDLPRIQAHKEKVRNEFKKSAYFLKKEIEDAEISTARSKESLLFPESTSYDQKRQTLGMQQRQLALMRLQAGVTIAGMKNDIEHNLKAGNIDYLGEMFNHLASNKVNGLSESDKFEVYNKLRNIFKERGLYRITERQEDIQSAKEELNGLKIYGLL